MNAWNDYVYHPLCGSQAYLSIGLSFGLPPAILLDIVKFYNYSLTYESSSNLGAETTIRSFKEQDFLDKMNLMGRHLAQAAEHAKKAVVAASDKEFIGICYYEGINGRPTRREYAELNYAPIAIAESLCRQRCNMLLAYHLLTDMEIARTTANEKKARRRKSRIANSFVRISPCRSVFANSSLVLPECDRVTRARV